MFKVSEVADQLRVNPKTVRGWIRDGLLRGTRLGHLYRITPEDLDEFIKEGIGGSARTGEPMEGRQD